MPNRFDATCRPTETKFFKLLRFQLLKQCIDRRWDGRRRFEIGVGLVTGNASDLVIERAATNWIALAPELVNDGQGAAGLHCRKRLDL